jgi:hypothetical protein
MSELDPASVLAAVARDPRLRGFLRDGEIVVLPVRQAPRSLLLSEVMRAFQPGVRYSERALSLFLVRIYSDYTALRGYLLDEHFLDHKDGEYWRPDDM